VPDADLNRNHPDGVVHDSPVASELSISPKTASVHVPSILATLGVSTRTEAAATVHRMHVLDGQ
jgi:DNA-binding NarL/FixJ family response regulator